MTNKIRKRKTNSTKRKEIEKKVSFENFKNSRRSHLLRPPVTRPVTFLLDTQLTYGLATVFLIYASSDTEGYTSCHERNYNLFHLFVASS